MTPSPPARQGSHPAPAPRPHAHAPPRALVRTRRYVTPGAFAESALYAGLSESDLKDWQLVAKVRYSLFKPGGDLAREFARNPTVLVVNDTVFAHGGLLPTHGEWASGEGEDVVELRGRRGCWGERNAGR